MNKCRSVEKSITEDPLWLHFSIDLAILRKSRGAFAEGAGAHCELGATWLTYGRIYDCLDDTFA